VLCDDSHNLLSVCMSAENVQFFRCAGKFGFFPLAICLFEFECALFCFIWIWGFLAIFFFPPGPRQFHSLLIFFLLHIQLPVRRRVNKSKSKLQADRFWHLTGSQLGAEKKAKWNREKGKSSNDVQYLIELCRVPWKERKKGWDSLNWSGWMEIAAW